MATAWPTSILPTFIELQDYSETPPLVTISSPIESGNPKIKYRFRANTRSISGYFFLTQTQVETLDNFFASDLAYGSLTLSFVHPRTSVTVEATLGKPSYKFMGKWWIADIKLTVLP